MTIAEHSIMQLTGRDGTAEFNVDPGKDTFRLTMGKETRSFRRVDLWALVYAMSDDEQQSKMMPVRKIEMLTYRRIHNIKVKKHLKPGDTIKCKCEMNVEQTVVEGLKGMIQQNTNRIAAGVPIIGAK